MNQPKERPILFSAPMVRAILAGQKTVTRRPVKPYQQPELMEDGTWFAVAQKHPRYGFGVSGADADACAAALAASQCCTYGRPGDRLWVRETWYCDHIEVQRGPYLQPADMIDLGQSRADGELVYAADGLEPYEQEQPIWKPSIHMPRWVSRILLEITNVRVERLQAISDEQCVAEGCGVGPGAIGVKLTVPPGASMPQAMFAELWKSINGPSAWDANPWVWVVEFKRVTP
ncbi:hypothetical protein [Pseudomonas eucalypticola]|uniref:Morphogenetic protein n=1 Tax=Pseudomonas eucalypticola TaxID=2599595 RepID=A0A7D5D835_9PSED|nr:hypothetical protein [Pseudomonas eucalypticola]QKZ05874.1 hypothetical protein HWQ56_19610 [Pseudomonas eucalypticola]